MKLVYMMIGIAVIFGLTIGSFLNVLIDRSPFSQSVLWGRSYCDHCKKTLRWFELIPLLSYIAQLGKCRRCHKYLRVQYPFVEAVTGLLFGIIFWMFQDKLFMGNWTEFSAMIFFASAAIVIVVADARFQLIPDTSIVLIVIASLIRWIEMPQNILVSMISAFGSFSLFYFLWWITHKKGMGFGDVKLACALGLFLSFPKIIVALYVAFLTGALVGVILIIVKYAGLKSKIAFGPFLIFGALVAVFWGSAIIHLWGGYI